MASNSFGKIFKMTTWGESHGKAIGVVIDGCPANIEIDEKTLNDALQLRASGRNPFTSPRREPDTVEILSGVFEGKTTGTPIAISILNKDVDSSTYHPMKDKLRPGHANFTYLEKYGIFDYRGGGRSSARETVARVCAGAIAKKILDAHNVRLVSYIKQIGPVEAKVDFAHLELVHTNSRLSPIFCPDKVAETLMINLIEEAKNEGDSLGGIVEFQAHFLPKGLGDPVYEKLEAVLAYAMMGIPASKGFEIGSGFSASLMKGSEHNDEFDMEDDKVVTNTNFAGGTLGGISTGMPLVGRVAFKPTSSIKKLQNTLTIQKEKTQLQISGSSRHDPCLAIRAVPVVEAMLALVLVDALLLNRCAK